MNKKAGFIWSNRMFLFTPLLLALFSCNTYKTIGYFKNISDSGNTTVDIAKFKEPVIQNDDILSIAIQTLDPDATAVLNKSNSPSSAVGASSAMAIGQQVSLGYLVDNTGSVELPVIGKVQLSGLTIPQARDTIRQRVAQLYKAPTVDVRFTNFKITVLGEVNKPSTFTVPNQKITVLDALGLAGDLTIYGKRENILLIRNKTEGQKEMVRLNLNSSKLFSSEYFYLQQNDVLYVEPSPKKAASLDNAQLRTFSIITTLTTLLIVIISRI